MTTLHTLLGLLLAAGAARAQYTSKVQNSDIRFLFGGAHAGEQTIPGTNIRVNGTNGLGMTIGYGYQVARVASVSIWAEFAQNFHTSGVTSAGIPGSVNTDFLSYIASGRFMFPIQSRVSAFAVLGGGGGEFHRPSLLSGPVAASYSTWHGVLETGGGLDIRVNRLLSVRIDVRDEITGRGLSGSSGRHHVIPLAGIAMHF